MSDIRNYIWMKHLRSEPSFHILRYKKGKLIQSGRGLAFWFVPMNTSVAEIPMGDRELPFMFHGRSKDFQDVVVQGGVIYHVTDPEALSHRLDFSIDLKRGTYLKDPLEQLSSLFTGHAQQIALRYLAQFDVRELVTDGLPLIQERIEEGLRDTESLEQLGLRVVTVQVNGVSPTSELEKALQTPTRELLQQDADKATFGRRALAVEKERAIAENELQNQIELAKREETLIEQRGENERRRAQAEVESRSIEVNGRAEATKVDAQAQAGRIQMVEGARVEAERNRIEIYRNLEPAVIMGLAAQELAAKLKNIEHVNITPDLLGPGLMNLFDAGTKRLQEG